MAEKSFREEVAGYLRSHGIKVTPDQKYDAIIHTEWYDPSSGETHKDEVNIKDLPKLREILNDRIYSKLEEFKEGVRERKGSPEEIRKYLKSVGAIGGLKKAADVAARERYMVPEKAAERKEELEEAEINENRGVSIVAAWMERERSDAQRRFTEVYEKAKKTA